MGRAAKEGVKLPTEDMSLVVLRRAIAAGVSAEAQSEWERARCCRRARVRAQEGKCRVTAPSSGDEYCIHHPLLDVIRHYH